MRRLALTALLLASACDPGDDGPRFLFELDANLDDPQHFYDQPFPLDTRLDATGHRRASGMPRPSGNANLEGFIEEVNEAVGAPVIPVVYFRATAPLAPRTESEIFPASASSPILLVDIDPQSPERGRLFPTVAMTLDVDDYTPSNLLATAPRPGFVLRPKTRYAMVVQRSLPTADGKPLATSAALKTLRKGGDPGGGTKAAFEPLWWTLANLGVDDTELAAATAFTTSDVVADLAAIAEATRASYDATLGSFAVDPDDGATHPRFCELKGTVTLPQFQRGTPPFDTEGRFAFDADGKLVKQVDVTVPVTITLPKQQMPSAGFPLVVFLHGSGGYSSAAVDRGTWRPVTDTSVCPDGHFDEWEGVTGCNVKGEGPAHVVAEHGFATVAAALPVNPERLPGAGETAYLNFVNLPPGRDLFRQGVIEQRLLLDALLEMKIDPASVQACSGLTLPSDATTFRFDGGQLYVQGQSMGGQYANLLAATDPRLRAVVPTGAGGFWSLFILQTSLVPGAAVGPILLGTNARLSFMHPALHLFEQAWEPVDPMVYMPRLARQPLPDHPVRPIYEPVGKGDSYFPTTIYDAMALAYGNRQAGSEVWPTMQQALALDARSGFDTFPISDNRQSGATKYTGVVVQYEGDGIYDPHALYSQLDAVKRQYSCFLKTMKTTGTATVIAPDAPCP